MSAPIRQPRGPSADHTSGSFGNPAPSPPPPDQDSLIRRNNTIGSTRHQPSASISASAAASGAFHGGKYRPKERESRFRSGSLSSNNVNTDVASGGSGLSRKPSAREVKVEAVVHEDLESPIGEQAPGGWGRGLSRQSSLPSRRGLGATGPHPPLPESMAPPPRPPRRISVITQDPSSPPQPTHSVSHSLSSLAMLNRPNQGVDIPTAPAPGIGASVSRTQSLRNQARHAQMPAEQPNVQHLGRSSSLRQPGEHYRSPSMHDTPPSRNETPRHPFTPPTPPPASSTAALPPFHLAGNADHQSMEVGGDVKRHQSLGNNYGRERAHRPPALLPLEKRTDTNSDKQRFDGKGDHPPLSPIGHSMWSPNQVVTGDDGWSRSIHGVQDAFAHMQMRENGGAGPVSGGQDRSRVVSVGRDGSLGPPSIYPNATGSTHPDEPSWVSNLVDGRDASPAPMPRAPSAPTSHSQWQEREAMLRNPQMFGNQRWPDGQGYLPLGYLQQQQQQQLLAAGFQGLSLNMPGYKNGPGMGGMPGIGNMGNMNGMNGVNGSHGVNGMGGMAYGQMGSNSAGYPTPLSGNFYMPSPPPPAPMGAQDLEVIELARKKGLNPASFDCRPKNARFFVIKSYTEDDVQKSLKHEIWSSTVLGNKRLDAAYKENVEKGPIYLFFSVNGSRHFCGVAQMLTPVDESQTSTVWAQDKWKGIFKVKWIFVRDVPSVALRHIRLVNTAEQKPITNSRDTQEVHYEGGCEVLQIFLEHQNKSKTSLLQDFAYYEAMSTQRIPGQRSPSPHMPPNGQQNTMMPPPLAMLGSAPPGQAAFMQMPQVVGMGNGVPPVPPIPSRYR